ncbi:MAG: hypothetical protein HYU66_11670 [Armatimonadetes bacterium]|nr:hypothetical protein [Armatimonadota bacterium]
MRSPLLACLLLGAVLALAAGCAPKEPEPGPAPADTGGAAPAPTTPAPADTGAPAAPSPSAAAPTPATPGVAKPLELTEQNIKNVLETIKDPKIKAVTEKFKGTGASGPSAMAAGLAGIKADAELTAIVKKHGFASWEEWAATTSKLWVGAYKLAMEKAQKEMGKSMDSMPAEARKQMEQAHAGMIQGTESAEKSVGGITAEELKAIDKMMPELEKAGKR